MRLTARLQLLILFIVLFSAFANYVLSNYQARNLHNNSEKLLANTVVSALSDALVQDVIDGNKLKVRNLLRKLTTRENPIDFMYITTTDGEVFAHSFDQGFPRYLINSIGSDIDATGVSLLNKFQTRNGVIFEYGEALIPGLDTILHIGINQTISSKQFNDNNQNYVLLVTGIILFSMIISLFISRRLTQPLAYLVDQIHLFGKGKAFDFSKLKSSSPEIIELSEAMQVASNEKAKALIIAQQREQNLSTTLHSIGDAVITTDASGNITRMNPVAEELTGWAFEDAKKEKFEVVFSIINASTREAVENPIDKVINTGEIVYLSNHTTLISRDGTEYQIADSAAPIRNPDDDEVQGIVLVFNDVSEQYKLRQAISESKKNLQNIMDHSPAIIYVKDIEGRFTFVNRKFSDLFHIAADEVYGKTLHDIFPQHIADEMKINDLDVLQTGQALESEELAPVGDMVHSYISTKFPLRNEKDEIYAICGISTDVTERKLKDEQLRRSQKMEALGKLTGGIAHDFNNMLGIILGYSELLSQTLKDDQKLSSYIQEVHKAGERGAKLTKKLLSFSRQKITDSQAHDINAIIKDQQHMLEKTLTARINLKLELSEKLYPVLLDSSDLEDSIVNMCINAMHAIDGKGQITIRTYNETVDSIDANHLSIEPGDYALLSITDTGSGMDEETKDQIFDPFFSTKGENGTGLGLSQVYGFIESSNGTIKVYSEIDHGTRFTMYFPSSLEVGEDQIPNALEQTNANKQDLNGSETILVVDDEPSLIKLTSNILHIHGYKIFAAENGRQALEILDNENIDLMLSDVIMPEMDGYELAEIVQKKYPQMKIQMASGFSDDRHENMVDKSLHENMLHKPYHSTTLLKRLRELFDEDI